MSVSSPRVIENRPSRREKNDQLLIREHILYVYVYRPAIVITKWFSGYTNCKHLSMFTVTISCLSGEGGPLRPELSIVSNVSKKIQVCESPLWWVDPMCTSLRKSSFKMFLKKYIYISIVSKFIMYYIGKIIS